MLQKLLDCLSIYISQVQLPPAGLGVRVNHKICEKERKRGLKVTQDTVFFMTTLLDTIYEDHLIGNNLDFVWRMWGAVALVIQGPDSP